MACYIMVFKIKGNYDMEKMSMKLIGKEISLTCQLVIWSDLIT